MEDNQIQSNDTVVKLSDNTPEYIKRKLATAKAQQEPQPSEEDVPTTPPVETPSEPTHTEPPQEENEVKAWKGRLNKEQTAHQETNQRLLAEVAARQKAEQEKLALEQQLAELQKPATPAVEETEENDFSDADWEDVRFQLGEKFTEKLRKRLKTATPSPIPDVEKVVDEKLTAAQQRQQAQTQAELFGKTLIDKVPRFQALVNDSAFIEFTNEKVIDFAGNTASALLNYAGQSKDLNLIPKIAELVAEFEQRNQPPSPVVTAPPSNKTASVSTQPKAKPEMTEKDRAKARALARNGKTKELRAFLNNFK